MLRTLPLFVAALLACGADPAPTMSAAVVDPPAIAHPQPPAPATAADDAPIGVAICDDYIDRYRRCIAEALPVEERPIHGDVVERQRLAWTQVRGDAVLAAELPAACAAAQTAARVAVPRCKHL